MTITFYLLWTTKLDKQLCVILHKSYWIIHARQ